MNLFYLEEIAFLLAIAFITSCTGSSYTLSNWDHDDNAYLDEDEFSLGLEDMEYYTLWNTDGEDDLTEDEWEDGIDEYFNAYGTDDFDGFSEWDIDDDDMISDDEFDSGVFETVDKNNDDQIDEEEFGTWYDNDLSDA